MQKQLNLQKMGEDFLKELQEYNKSMWDAMHFRLIYAKMTQEIGHDFSKKIKIYRKERLEKARKLAKGDKNKMYNLLSSENFI